MESTTKYEISFNENGFQEAHSKLKEQIADLNELEALKGKLSDELNIKVTNLDKLEQHLKKKTGFTNLLLASDALGIKELYERFISLNSIASIDKKLVAKEGNRFVLKEAVLADLMKDYTFYIPEELRKEFDGLNDVMELLNGLNPVRRRALVKNAYGEYIINKNIFVSKL